MLSLLLSNNNAVVLYRSFKYFKLMRRFKNFDTLRVFDLVAAELSITRAAAVLHMTKGAVSYQVKRLEQELGFPVFNRHHGGVSLTPKGRRLWHVSQASFQQLEQEINRLKGVDDLGITIGMSTYFASRWLSPRLMRFTSSHPDVGLRLQPATGIIDLEKDRIDMAIRWGDGSWNDMNIEPLFNCPAIATAGLTIAERIKTAGLDASLAKFALLHDTEDSTAWQDWHRAARIPYRAKPNELVIPDPNVRVQAVVDGQGLALNDALVQREIADGLLFKVSEVELKDYGYFLAYRQGSLVNPALSDFRNWILSESELSYISGT